MLFDDKKQALCRIAVGAVAGVAVHVLLGYVLGTLGFFGDRLAAVFSSPTCSFPAPFAGWGILLSYLLFALLGAEIGVSTLPFADHGRTLVLRTLAHFALMAATVALWGGLNFGGAGAAFCLILLASIYVLVWLGRWVGWYVEVAAIRAKLGLAPGPSLLHWRESLPYLVFALGLCLGLPALLRLVDPQDVPVLSGVYFPFLLLPIGTFCSGVSLGHRHGFSPLYPAACALLSVAAVFLLFNGSALFHGGISLVCALVGNGVGTLLKKRATREKNP
ncbi:DUF3021 family protein [Pseudoflavonifractor sp. SW1122]|uniref:DUF3021 family protein n=1 Tax=Pseudoflavonifractor sp. SW1122 TaxID=2530044 RepID=UPI001438BE2E|nr:DUF3021 family protein [Pseudoflavonifractor sp. SW1122]NJE74120.1 DUF3021 family protein [Pseudoflavonifractor sp. SW1122]